jgi:hypothetical protein
MRKLILLVGFVVLGITANAQAGYQTFANDTVKGDTLTTTATVNVPYNGFVTWDYTCTGYSAGDTVYIDFQGSNNSWTTWQTLSTTTFIQGTTTANQHLVDDPAEYLRYRLVKRAYEVTDTAIFTNKLFIYKR